MTPQCGVVSEPERDRAAARPTKTPSAKKVVFVTFLVMNFLSEQGLGGPYELAEAQARFYLASTVYP